MGDSSVGIGSFLVHILPCRLFLWMAVINPLNNWVLDCVVLQYISHSAFVQLQFVELIRRGGTKELGFSLHNHATFSNATC